MLQVWQQSCVRIRPRWNCASLQAINRTRCIRRLTDDVKPFLDFVFVFELRQYARSVSGKEGIEIKFIKLAAASNMRYFRRHLIGQQSHLG